MTGAPRQLFRRSQRLSKDRDYQAVFSARVRKSVGPVTVYARPNGLETCRLGLSVSRKVGKAVTRNRLKRLVREAYRLDQHDLPVGLDLIVVLRPHEPGDLPFYRAAFSQCAREVASVWAKRARREGEGDA